ncbi:MAG: hypothetical protein M3680_34960 [Myxococcota bacterium]|nr:hypothetical protein [Myxococcota bacterium]
MTMKPRLLLLLVMVIGCATEEDSLTTTESELSRGNLVTQGYHCWQPFSGGFWRCQKCTAVEVVGDEGSQWVTVCSSYRCDETPISSTCTMESSYARNNTFDTDNNVWFEAEAATRYGSMQVKADANASGGSYLYVAGSGSTRATFDAAVAGSVTAWVRAIVPSSSANSFYLQLDAVSTRYELPITTTWTWIPLDLDQFVGSGTHTLRLYADEVGVKIDRILLTSNPEFVPVVQTVQAEVAAIVAPMQAGTQRSIPTTTFLWVPNGAGSGGLAQWQLAMPYTGNYTAWGRFLAPTEADNSFSIGTLGKPRTTWSVPVASSWGWSRTTATFGLDGDEVLELAQREDGTKVDKLVLTNDPGFTLVEPAQPVVTQ